MQDLHAVEDSERRVPKDRSHAARQAAYTLHSRYDSRELTKPAREKFLARFEDQVDPDHTLPEAERLRRADYAKKAYMLGLARKSAAVRARRKAKP